MLKRDTPSTLTYCPQILILELPTGKYRNVNPFPVTMKSLENMTFRLDDFVTMHKAALSLTFQELGKVPDA